MITKVVKNQTLLMGLLALYLSDACTSEQGNKINTEEAKSATESIFDGVSEAEAHLIKSGGILSIAEAKVLIPSGALSTNSKATLKKIKTGFSASSQDERLAIAWNLEKGNLLKEIAISMKVDAISNDPWLKIGIFDPVTKQLKLLISRSELKVEETETGKKWITFATTETQAAFIVIDPEVVNTKIIINDEAIYTKDPLLSVKVLASSSSYVERAVVEGEDCSAAILSAEKSETLPLKLASGDGPKILCSAFTNYWGDRATGSGLIILDTTPPSAESSMPEFINADFTPGSITTITGTSLDETSGLASVGVALSPDGGTLCLNEAQSSFDSPCPVWHIPEGLESWGLTVNDEILVDGTTYSIYAVASDSAGNIQAEPSPSTFVWDLTPPVAALQDVPQDVSKIVSLDIDVLSDTGLVAYRYKVGQSANVDCSEELGYSLEFVPETQNIKESLLSLPEGGIKLCVVGKDAAGNIQSFNSATSALWVKDTIAPNVEAGDSLSARVQTTLDATVSDVNAVTYQWSKKNGLGTLTFTQANAEDTDVSAVGEGTYEILLTVIDAAGNSASDSLFFTWDTVAPNSVFSINADATNTNTTAVSIALLQTLDVVAFRKANGSDCSSAIWEDLISHPLAHTLATGDGVKTVCLEVKDAIGNISVTSTDTIVLDTTLPISSITVPNLLGPESTLGNQTNLSGTELETGSGIDKIYVSLKNDGSGLCLDALKTTFNATCPNWLVTDHVSGWSINIPDSILVNSSAYTIESKALDLAGNEQSPTVISGFTWDSQAPDATFKINADAPYTNNATVDIDVTTSTGIAMYRINSGADCSGAAWQTFVSSPISFILPDGDGTNTVCLQVKDSVGNVSTVVTDTIILDTLAPESTISTQGTIGLSSTAGNMTDIVGTASDTLSGLDKVYLSVREGAGLCLNDDLVTFNAACPHWLQTTGSATWSLSINDTTFSDATTYTLTSKAVDLATNDQVYFGSASVIWDGTPPNPIFVINADATYTNNPSVALTLSLPTGVARYRASEGADCSSAAWQNFTSNTLPITLTGGEGLRTVCLEVEDSVGNQSSTATDTITLDLTPPVSVSLIPSALGPQSTAGSTTVIGGTASDALSGLASIVLSIQNGSGFYLRADALAYDSLSPVWHNASGTGTWSYVLTDSLLVDNMTYQVSIKGSDNSGNTESPAISASFTWDSGAPSSSFSIEGGAEFTNTTNVAIGLVTPAGVAMYRIAEGNDCSGASWVPYGAISFNVSNGDGVKTICLQVKDSLGNVSVTTTQSIALDATKPVSTISTSGSYGPNLWSGSQTAILGSAVDNGGSLVASVNVSIEETGSGLCLNAGKSAFDATCPEWHLATGKTSWSLLVNDSLFTDSLTYNLSSQAWDNAANVQLGFGTSSITWDAVAPSAQFVINGDATYANATSVSLTITDPSGVSQYRKANGADCSGATWIGYSVNPISHSLTTTQGLQTVCLQVKDAVGNVSSTATDNIIYESILPTSTVDALGTIGPESQTGATTTLSGTASDDVSGVSSVSISVQAGAGNCLNAGETAYDAACPVWHVVSGTNAWTFVLNDSLLVDGTYNISARATDIAGNTQTSFGTGSFTWDKTIDFFLIGQRNYKATDINRAFPSQNTFYSPSQIIEDNGKFFVSDWNNNRILIFENGLDNPPNVLVGQAAFDQGSANAGVSPTANTLSNPIQIAISGTAMIVADRNNNRILIWNTIPTANYTPADVVLGQPDFTSNLINRDGSTVATANSLYRPHGVAVANNKLIVSDRQNNRALIWNTIPTVSDTPPDLVIGQADFTSNSANRGGTLSANSLNQPILVATDGTAIAIADQSNYRVLIWNSVPTAWDVDADVVACQADFISSGATATQSGCKPAGMTFTGGSLYIADSLQHRIMYYATIPVSGAVGAATGVFGQGDYTSVSLNRGVYVAANNALYSPYSISIINTNAYIADTGNNRILKFNTPPTAVGTDVADAVYGQNDFVSNLANQVPISRDGFNGIGCIDVNATHLIIGDRYNGRVLVYEKATIENGPIAVIGKGDYASGCHASSSPPCTAPTDDNLSEILGCDISDDGHIFLSDRFRNRILVYNSVPAVNGAHADFVLGQDDFVSSGANSGTNGYGKLNGPYDVESSGSQLFVADTSNHRVLVYSLPISANRQLADFVIGQPNETTFSGAAAVNKFSYPSAVNVVNGKLIVLETSSKVKIFNTIPSANNANADVVLGQPDFVTNNAGSCTQQTFGASNLTTSVAVVDNILVIPDRDNNRLLNFDWTNLSTYANAISVVGQDDYISDGTVYSNADGSRFKNLYGPAAVVYDGDFVWVAEMSGRRVSRIKKALFMQMVNSP